MKTFTPFILIIICIAAYYTYLQPTYTEVRALMEKKDNYNDILQKAKDIITKRDSIMNSYNSLSPEDVDRLNKFLPESFDSVLVINHINNIANRYGMVVQNVVVSQQILVDPVNTDVVSNTTSFKTHNVSFYVVGRYDNFISFLKDLETNLNLVDIIKLTVSSDTSKTGEKTQNMQYSFDVNTYSLN